jgi:hypothetical protein
VVSLIAFFIIGSEPEEHMVGQDIRTFDWEILISVIIQKHQKPCSSKLQMPELYSLSFFIEIQDNLGGLYVLPLISAF